MNCIIVETIPYIVTKHLYLHVDWYLINVTLKWIGYMSFVGEIDNNFKRFLSFEYIEYNQIVIKGGATAVCRLHIYV
jgi:hypothetical protein